MIKPLTECLKNTPKGAKLYSPIFGECTFLRIKDNEIQVIDTTPQRIRHTFNAFGGYNEQGECLLFPSKEVREWTEYRYTPKYRPFKDAQECMEELRKHIPIGWVTQKLRDETIALHICSIQSNCVFFFDSYTGESFNGLLKHYSFYDGSPIGVAE